MTDQIFRARVNERVDARDKVTGDALYPGDITPPDLLHGRILFSGQPHARMLSMDTRAAEELPGVVAVLTAKDVPVNEYGLILPDQPVMVGLGSSNPHADVSLWEGDHVAVVVAETEAIAARACGLATAFVPRPMEHGPGQIRDLQPEQDWDVVAHDFGDLDDKLGA